MIEIKPRLRCNLCGGDRGAFSPDGAHYLCAARAAQGLPTPCLGMRCARCDGRGTIGRGGVMMGFDLGPSTIARSIRAQFPPCPDCAGTGQAPI